ncbi:MAG: PEP-CTERM system histidine kinase PrsK [Candidatus Thiodiazotropha sp. (ex Lucina pensylvanica)]|nr:PEP-CTERM system histidine kinase PrsK [Candidatus Thiodiazotropha sp. (ex Lucina pensylvanica)]MBT3030399.1 PEP-CTERM system histidine kinase PrsK [Candidatus Thiodiazotropha sp. (ex Lucina pensylvanica)]MBT3042167.1 PEP-CTERM system histidine kinase PrsK [Candidatus Thiodiazotropha sp. (ex Codakia orbicularis)]MBT3051496.1 PEP-CTERM system histidine kinase PrsK [Candidatus Thiodiazotropha sp. (ex Codakia orbicularis)]MBT3054588.1 PEP-CTERM system histidine kinase PrsK [Candidatus Thiodiazo
MSIGIIGYAISATLFLLFSVMLVTSWRGRIEGIYLLTASVTTACWALAAVALQVDESVLTRTAYQIFEIARNIAWFVFLFRLLFNLQQACGKNLRNLAYIPIAILIGSTVLIAVEPISQLFPVPIGTGGFASYPLVGYLGFAITGLTLIEQLYRSTRPEMRWSVKYLYLGMGVLFVYDFFLYAEALLFNRVDTTLWQARGLTSALAVPFVAIAATRNPSWSVRVFVSKQVVFHATTIIAAGAYLVTMAAVGYYIRFYGGSWGKATQVAFVFAGVIFLITALFSGNLRSKLKVFVNKHFFSYKYDWRDEWLRVVQTLSNGRGGKEIRIRVIQAISESIDAGGGYLWMSDNAGGYQCVSHWQVSANNILFDSSDSLVTYFSNSDWIIDVDEYKQFPERYESLKLDDQLIAIDNAWLIIPVKHHEQLLGFVLLSQPKLSKSVNWEDRDLIKAAAKQAGSYLALLQTSEALNQANQFEAFNRLSAFVVHDLKNLIAQLELVVKNAERHKNNPEFMDDAVKTIGNAVSKMGRLLTQLRQGRFESTKSKEFYVEESVAQAVNQLYAYLPKPRLTINANFLKIIADKDRFTAIMVHMIKNAQEASQEDGKVDVTVDRDNNYAVITIEDNGVGMDALFIKERLFRPFQTTKGNAGMGIGVYETREYVNSLNGKMKVESVKGVGTKFEISIPLEVAGQAINNHISTTAEA